MLHFYAASPHCAFVYLLEDAALGGLARLFSALHHEVPTQPGGHDRGYESDLFCDLYFILIVFKLHNATLVELYYRQVQFWSVSAASAVLQYAMGLPGDSPHYPHRAPTEALYAAGWGMLPQARSPALSAGVATCLLQTTLVLAKVGS